MLKNFEEYIRANYSTKKGHENEVIAYYFEYKIKTKDGRQLIHEPFKVSDYKSPEIALRRARQYRDKFLDELDANKENINYHIDADIYKVDTLFHKLLTTKNRSKSDIENHVCVYNTYIAEYGQKDIRSILPADIQASLDKAAPNNVEKSVKRLLGYWKAIYRIANSYGLNVIDATEHVEIPKCKKKTKRSVTAQVISEENYEIFCDVLSTYGNYTDEESIYNRKMIWYMVRFMYATGCRPQEIKAWHKSNITVFDDHAEILVNSSIGSDANNVLCEVDTKTDASIRTVSVRGEYLNLLKEALKYCKHEIMFSNYDGSFLHSDDLSGYIHDVKGKCERLGYTFDVYAYIFRKTFATRWAKKVAPKTLAKMMGHSDPKTTLKYYIQIDEEETMEAWLSD